MSSSYNISYNKLWKLLIDKKIRKMKLLDMAKISSSTLAKLSCNKPVSLDVLIRIIKSLNCGFDDIMEVVDERNI